jgi:hypothetical protein
MFNSGKCPKCEKRIDHLDMDSITIGNKLSGPLYRGVSVVCPDCKAIVGAAIDPRSLREDIVNDILAGLGAKPRNR